MSVFGTCVSFSLAILYNTIMSDYSNFLPDPLLWTKVFKPVLRPGIVERPRLMKVLNAGHGDGVLETYARLILVSAPAGFGKTTLVSAWLAQAEDVQPAWLSLDEGDNDPVRFLAYLIAAVQVPVPGAAETAEHLLQSPQPAAADTVLTILINDISQNGQPIIIVLDDYQAITNPSVHQALSYLVDHLPPTLHLLINTRSDPPLPLSRLRARGQLLEIRADDLRFSLNEAGRFFSQVMDLSLANEELAVLEQRTEGWIAGLQLAGLSMQGRDDLADFIAAFAGSNRYILDYLTDEVLDQRPEGTRSFLLQTSILNNLCGPLCDAVTCQTTGQATLERIDQANLFLIPLDEARHWYRYHHLFAEVLRQRLHKEQSSNLPELHRRARVWLENNGLAHEAIPHSLAGHDFDQAARLIEHIHGDKWQSGEIKTLQNWLAALPAESWQSHPRLWLIQAWAAMTVGEFDAADEMLHEAETALSLLDEETARGLHAELLAFRASHASLTQDPQAVKLAEMALQELPSDYWMRGMLVVFLGSAYYTMGDLDAAAGALALAPGARSGDTGLRPHQIHLLAFGGMVQLAKGNLQAARSLVSQALNLAEPGGEPIPYVGTLMAYMAASLVLYELGEIDLVESYLNRCLTLAISFGSAEVQIFALSGLVRSHLARDDIKTAAGYIGRIDGLLDAHTFNLSISAYVRYHRFQLLLKQGNLAAAEEWATPPSEWLGPLNAYALHRVAQSQLLIAQGEFAAALEKLQILIAETEIAGHITLLVKALILQALAHHGLGRSSHAQAALENALALAGTEGFVQAFVDEGQPIESLLLQARQRSRFANYIDNLLDTFRAKKSKQHQPDLLPEPLSERELEVLRLAAAGATNMEIAERLFITLPTVKKHMGNIFVKLDTSNRTQAVTHARELHLLS